MAHDWGMRPSELGICHEQYDLTMMAAYSRTKGLMTAYAQQEQQKEHEKDRLKRQLKKGK